LERMSRAKRFASSCLRPLLQGTSPAGRIHAGWKWDTSTGRLVSRSPNLQNLPATGEAGYNVRKAFCAPPGCVLIRADYAQLELCVLAHVSNCASMVSKLHRGSDFHSEVAAEMFPEIQEAIQRGEAVVSAQDPRRLGVGGEEPLPTVKERFPVLRSQAKAINFGIIYGLAPASLAEDLKIEKEAAKAMMERWFEAKPGVARWIAKVKREGMREQRVLSLLGRWRNLPLLRRDAEPMYRNRSERAAVNFGIQGSAADIVTAAMLRLWKDACLQELGFRLVMQVHDEFVLEGPEGHAQQALDRTAELMRRPFDLHNADFKFRVPLVVDARVCRTLGDE